MTPVLPAALLLWTLLASAFDLRTRQVPPWVLYPPPALGLLAFAVQAGPLPALLVLAAWLATELDGRRGAALTVVAVGLLLLLPAGRVIGAYWLVAYILWRLDLAGGADAVTGLGIVLWLPRWGTLAALGAGLTLWAWGCLLGALIRRRLARTVTPFAWLGLRAPGLPGYLLGLALLAASGLGWFGLLLDWVGTH